MSEWWYVIAVAGILVVGMLYLRSRMRSESSRGNDRRDSTTDFRQNREADRLAHMSEDDRAWEAASRQRYQDAQVRKETPAADPPAERQNQ